MKIGILGCGNLGSALAHAWSEAGHEVLRAGREQLPYAEVVEQCPVLLYTLRSMPPKELAPTWNNKVVIDCNLEPLPESFEFEPRSRSLAEELAEQIPLSQVVKALCLHPVELYHHGAARLREWGVQSFFCGDSGSAKEVVQSLLSDLGLLPFDCGGLKRARLLENQANLWRLFQLQQGQGLVSQFQLVGYPEPESFVRRPSWV